jgi:hypothetical protein
MLAHKIVVLWAPTTRWRDSCVVRVEKRLPVGRPSLNSTPFIYSKIFKPIWIWNGQRWSYGARSRLFMTTLMGQSCWALVAQALLVYFYVCAEMPGFCDCCGKLVWPSGEPDVWEETWEPTPWAAAEDFTS